MANIQQKFRLDFEPGRLFASRVKPNLILVNLNSFPSFMNLIMTMYVIILLHRVQLILIFVLYIV